MRRGTEGRDPVADERALLWWPWPRVTIGPRFTALSALYLGPNVPAPATDDGKIWRRVRRGGGAVLTRLAYRIKACRIDHFNRGKM